MLIAGSFKATIKGCSVVYYIASLFLIKNKIRDSRKEVVKPALKETQNILDTIQKYETIRLIILTLSVAAIFSDNIDILGIKNKTLSSEYFNTSSSITYNAYLFSKVITKKEA